MPTDLDRVDARDILDSLAESGQPPKLGVLHFNVGTEDILSRLRHDYLEDRLRTVNKRDGKGTCRFAVAEYGNGKTHFLRCLQEEAWRLNYVTSYVELSQHECPLDKPERVYAVVARGLQATPQSAGDVDREKGIGPCLQQLFDRLFPGVLSGAPDPALTQEAKTWIDNTLLKTNVESPSYLSAVAHLLRGKLSGDHESAGIANRFLMGDPVPAAETKKIQVYEKLARESGMRFLRSLCQILQRTELASGLVLLFDEARRVLSLMTVKQQKVACENLLTVINSCNAGDFPGTLFVYAVMTDFFINFADHYPALQQRCGPSTRINLNHLEGFDDIKLLVEIGKRILIVYRSANSDGPKNSDILESNLLVLSTEAWRQTQGNGTRRALVRAWVHALRELPDIGRKPLQEEAARSFIANYRDTDGTSEVDPNE